MKGSEYACVSRVYLASIHVVDWVDRQMASDAEDNDALVSTVEEAKRKTFCPENSWTLGMNGASYAVVDGCRLPDTPPGVIQNALLFVQAVVNETVCHPVLGLSLAVDVDVSLAYPLQLANDSSLMDSVETSPCKPRRHLRRRREGNEER